MKATLHPTWYPEAVVVCACGNTWTTGATVPNIKTDICSNCHPFYTGEQRIVDTEGQVDRFLKRLQVRDSKRSEREAREAAKTPMSLSLADLGVEKRYVKIFADNGVNTVGELLGKLETGGDQAVLDIPGIGQGVLASAKKLLRSNGYEVPQAEASE